MKVQHSIRLLGLATYLAATQAQACLIQESENNNTEARANAGLCSAQAVTGSISSSTDVDWFSFDTVGTADISISLSHGSTADFDFYLYRSSGSYILSGQSSARPETGTYKAAAGGKHFVKVSRYSGTGSYTLTVNFAGASGGGGGTPPAACSYGVRPSKPGGLSSFIVGSSTDVCPSLTAGQGALLLMGGGTDVDAAFSNRVAPRIQGGNIVVLRTSGTDAYNTYLQGLTGAASVETVLVDTVSKANSAYVDWVIRSAEAVFIAGGDQSAYLNAWQGTLVQAAIKHVYDKGGVVGGTSAGNHVLSQQVYDPDGVAGAISSEVVTDYCHNTLKFSSNFLNFPLLNNTINDTHFRQRDRMGRSVVFQAKLGSSGRVIAVSEATSLFVTADGQGVVDGSNEVYVLRADAQTQYSQLSCGQPVIINNLLKYKLLPGDSYNLSTNSTVIVPGRVSVDGRNSSFYSPLNPY